MVSQRPFQFREGNAKRSALTAESAGLCGGDESFLRGPASVMTASSIMPGSPLAQDTREPKRMSCRADFKLINPRLFRLGIFDLETGAVVQSSWPNRR